MYNKEEGGMLVVHACTAALEVLRDSRGNKCCNEHSSSYQWYRYWFAQQVWASCNCNSHMYMCCNSDVGTGSTIGYEGYKESVKEVTSEYPCISIVAPSRHSPEDWRNCHVWLYNCHSRVSNCTVFLLLIVQRCTETLLDTL